jgi:hypothetical protein
VTDSDSDTDVALQATRALRVVPLLVAASLAAAFGMTLGSHPLEAVLLLVLVPLALTRPTATLGLILFVTVLVPFDVQNRYSLGGKAGLPGLLAVDLLLGVGLCRLVFLLLRGRLRVGRPMVVAGAVMVGGLAAAAHGVAVGAAVSDAGTEARCLVFGLGSFLLAWPLLLRRATRTRLSRTLLALGLALGLWGIAQVVFHVAYSSGGDVGVRPGIDQIAAAGGGQLQGGLYAYPVAVAMSFAALLAPARTSVAARGLTVAVFALNSVCVLLTFERSIWVAALIGCVAAAIRSGRAARPAALRWLALAAAAAVVYGALSPGTVSTSIDRVQSIFSYSSESSYQSRHVESEAVLQEIRREPIVGSGFGATVTWGQRNVFAPRTTNFTHEGYLWLAWKIGTPLALVLSGCLLFAALRPLTPTSDEQLRSLRVGSHAALLASLAVCVAFPEFNALGITAVLGVVAAACLAPEDQRGRIDTGATSTTL